MRIIIIVNVILIEAKIEKDINLM